jgi:hypothetical protein
MSGVPISDAAERTRIALHTALAHPFATRSFRFSVMRPKTLW